jgi:hypothetical protein
MPRTLGWQRSRELWIRLLEQRTGEGVEAWNQRILSAALDDETGLRSWLSARGVTGYAQSLLVMERFGYPDFLVASPEELIDAQYAEHPELRPVLDAIIAATDGFGTVVVQGRKTYVSLVAPRRTFARVKCRGSRVDLHLRLWREPARGRLRPSKVHPLMPLQIELSSPDQVDAEVRDWLYRTYLENA